MSVGPEFTGAGQPGADAARQRAAGRAGGAAEAVVDGAFRPRVTAARQRHPVTAGLPRASRRRAAKPDWGPWYRRIEPGSRSSGDALLMRTPDGEPLLVLDRVGEGRVALLLSDQIWLWSRGHQGGGPQAELLRRIAHWLMQEPELEENALTARAEARPARGRAPLHRPERRRAVTVTDPDGQQQTLALTPTRPGRAVGQPAGRRARGVAGYRRRAHRLCRRGRGQPAGDGRPARHRHAGWRRWRAAAAAACTGSSPAGAPELRRTEPGREAAGGALDRAAAAARPSGHRHRRHPAAAALAGAAADPGAAGAGLAAGGKLRWTPRQRTRPHSPGGSRAFASVPSPPGGCACIARPAMRPGSTLPLSSQPVLSDDGAMIQMLPRSGLALAGPAAGRRPARRRRRRGPDAARHRRGQRQPHRPGGRRHRRLHRAADPAPGPARRPQPRRRGGRRPTGRRATCTPTRRCSTPSTAATSAPRARRSAAAPTSAPTTCSA